MSLRARYEPSNYTQDVKLRGHPIGYAPIELPLRKEGRHGRDRLGMRSSSTYFREHTRGPVVPRTPVCQF